MSARTTIKDIARVVVVHHATVSRALRDDPRVAPQTIEIVKKAADRLGYKPDPMMMALAVYRTTLRQTSFKETLAYIWPEAISKEVTKLPYLTRSIQAARNHASRLGYSIDEFFLTEQEPSSVQRTSRQEASAEQSSAPPAMPKISQFHLISATSQPQHSVPPS